MTKTEYAVRISGVGKYFKLPTESTQSLRTSLVNQFRGIKGYKEQHVLKDVSFEVEKGDFFGILGRNGSGKSTLLKIISQIYVPDKGKVEVNGKLVSFIELGVGFNPELTGRENVYLNGALLGFSPVEIDQMYGEIVAFAELEEFMNQKLKNYSSGMQVRLAFSVAIKAQGDILVLDEVLAVGDEAFQRKCNDYFLERKKSGQTTILVTHDMGAVKKYCNKAVLIADGLVKRVGNPEEVANQYSLDNADSIYKAASRYLPEDFELFNPADFEMDARLFESEKVTVYYDLAGAGFSQDRIRQFPLKSKDCLQIPIPKECHRIRIDLSEQASYFTRVKLEQEGQPLLPSYSSGIINGECHLFPDPDPQLTFELKEGIEQILLDYEVAVSKESEKWLSHLQMEFTSEETTRDLEAELVACKRYIQQLEEKLQRNETETSP